MIQPTTELVCLVLGTTSGSGAAAIGYAVMQEQQTTLTSSTLVPLGILLSGIALSATLAWKSASNHTRMKIKLEQHEQRIARLENAKCCTNHKR